jgi:thiol-disulfide isomerase/thioredoxin
MPAARPKETLLRLPVALGSIVTALVLTACGDDGNGAGVAAPSPSPSPAVTMTPSAPSDTPVPAPTATETPSVDVRVAEELDFTVQTLDGATFEGASLAGRPAVLWFWAPWCPVCQREAPLIADLAAQYEGQVAFVGVAGLSGDLAAMEEFVTDGGVDGIAHIDDRDGEVYSRFEVTQQYDLGLVSADGVVEVLRGPLDEDEIVAAVERLAAG